MFRLILIGALLAGTSLVLAADQPKNQSPHQSARQTAPVSARQTMLKLIDALTRHDIPAARELSLSFDEFAALSVKKPDQKDYQERLEGFLQGISRELSSTVELKEAGLADMLIVPPGVKTKKELVMAVIHATFQIKGKPGKPTPIPFLFISQAGKWKFFLRK